MSHNFKKAAYGIHNSGRTRQDGLAARKRTRAWRGMELPCLFVDRLHPHGTNRDHFRRLFDPLQRILKQDYAEKASGPTFKAVRDSALRQFSLGGGTQLPVHFPPQLPRQNRPLAALGDSVRLSRRSVFKRPNQSRLRIDHDDLPDPPFLIKTALAQDAREGIFGRENLYHQFKWLDRIGIADAAFRRGYHMTLPLSLSMRKRADCFSGRQAATFGGPLRVWYSRAENPHNRVHRAHRPIASRRLGLRPLHWP